ncbi:MAG TPA: hypothetical protein VFK01_09765, partial [Bradyrhizobium sp.]|nr:hypothetical protein [Bradyrhizobium sp.]
MIPTFECPRRSLAILGCTPDDNMWVACACRKSEANARQRLGVRQQLMPLVGDGSRLQRAAERKRKINARLQLRHLLRQATKDDGRETKPGNAQILIVRLPAVLAALPGGWVGRAGAKGFLHSCIITGCDQGLFQDPERASHTLHFTLLALFFRQKTKDYRAKIDGCVVASHGNSAA